MAGVTGRIDLHMHSTVSDGTDTPEQLMANVIAAGIGVFSVTDHDAVKSALIFRPVLRAGGPRFIPGVEFSCKDEQGKYHILGYGFDPVAVAVNAVVEHAHSLRMRKVQARLDFLRDEFGVCFPPEEIENLLAMDNPGKPHIGNLMVKFGFAGSMDDAISNYINRFRFSGGFIRPEEAIGGILASGGIPVLAHPFYGSGDELIVGDDMDARLRRLMDCGLRGIEAFYYGFTAKLRNEALALADRYDLFVTAGSDYHGGNKLVALGDTGLDAWTEYPRGLQRFLEQFGIV